MGRGEKIAWQAAVSALRPTPGLRSWLQAQGSLTQHLWRAFGPITVQRIYQGPGRARADEARVLGLTSGQRVHVREVVLRSQGQALVMARSVTETRHLRGAWRALKGLGSRPLAELLFHDRQVRREPLMFCRAKAPWLGSAVGAHKLAAASAVASGLGCCQRRSVFKRRGAKLVLAEVFLKSGRSAGTSCAPESGLGSCWRQPARKYRLKAKTRCLK